MACAPVEPTRVLAPVAPQPVAWLPVGWRQEPAPLALPSEAGRLTIYTPGAPAPLLAVGRLDSPRARALERNTGQPAATWLRQALLESFAAGAVTLGEPAPWTRAGVADGVRIPVTGDFRDGDRGRLVGEIAVGRVGGGVVVLAALAPVGTDPAPILALLDRAPLE